MDSTTSTYDANDRLTSDTYDANGNTTTGHIPAGGTALHDVYDYEDHLISRNSGQVTVTYDGDGNRVSKTVGGVTTLFLVDDRNPSGYAQVLEEHTSLNSQPPTLSRLYTYGTDLVSQDQWTGTAWTLSFYGYDGHGNVRYLTDTNAAVTDTYDYDAFGTLIAQSGTTPNNYLYCGQQFDVDLSLYYNRARYLNADSGRFWTMDAFGGALTDPISLHRYLFADVDSVNGIDPSGNETVAEVSSTEAVDQTIEGARPTFNAIRQACKAKGFINAAGSLAFYSQLILIWSLAATDSGHNSAGGEVLQATSFAPDSLIKKAGLRYYYKTDRHSIVMQLAFDYKDGTRVRLSYDTTRGTIEGQVGENIRLDKISVCGYEVAEISLTWRIGLPTGLSVGLQARILGYGLFQTKLGGSGSIYGD